MIGLSKLKIKWRRGKQYTSPVTLVGRHKYGQKLATDTIHDRCNHDNIANNNKM